MTRRLVKNKSRRARLASGLMPGLYVSRAGLSCDDVARFLHEAGVTANVTANLTVTPQDTGPARENGCHVRFTGRDPVAAIKAVWPRLRRRFRLDCAYVDAAPRFQGCVMDLIRPSACPGTRD